MTSDDAIFITHLKDARYLDVNDGFVSMTGWTRHEVIGKTALDINIWNHLVDRQRLVDALARDGFCRNLEAEFLTKDRHVLVGLVSARVIHLRGEQCMLLVARDITERKAMERQVQQLAFYDPLTSLPNRRLLDDRLSQAMAASKRSGCHCALMFIDLDNFKPLNDAHGHHVGDLLLCETALRLRGCVREMDTVARFGGDEFVVILGELDINRAESAQLAMNVALKIQDAMSSPCVLDLPATELRTALRVTHCCSASIGVTLFFNHEGTPDEIFRWADSAMYRAKAAGRNCVCFYEH
jgi:diguanylate cyclase (GGDEF)-like protein/PAS domain S-box-containing protein